MVLSPDWVIDTGLPSWGEVLMIFKHKAHLGGGKAGKTEAGFVFVRMDVQQSKPCPFRTGDGQFHLFEGPLACI